MKIEENNPLEYYLQLDYPITVYHAEEGGYVAEIEDFPGCITEGESLEEVINRIDSVKIAWIETAYEDNMEIPLPRTDYEYSGKFLVRIPKYLHRNLAELASKEGVSLNSLVEAILSSGIATTVQNKKLDEIILKLKNLEEKTNINMPTTIIGHRWELEAIEPAINTSPKKEHLKPGHIHERTTGGVIAA